MSTSAVQTRMTVLQQWQTWLIIIIITYAKVLQIFGKPININQLHTHTLAGTHKSTVPAKTFTSGAEYERVLDTSCLRYSWETNLPNRPQATRPQRVVAGTPEHGQKSFSFLRLSLEIDFDFQYVMCIYLCVSVCVCILWISYSYAARACPSRHSTSWYGCPGPAADILSARSGLLLFI